MSISKSVYLGDFTCLSKTDRGHKIYLDTRDISLAPHIMLDGVWETWIAELVEKVVLPGMRVVEVGANVGYFTLLLAGRIGPNGSIDTFEANPSVYKNLYRSLAINGFLDRVRPHCMAVADRCGTVPFHTRLHYQGSSSLHAFDPAEVEGSLDEVKSFDATVTSLDAFFEKSLQPIDFIKMDAEGAEGLIVSGMQQLLACSPNLKIVMEYSPIQLAALGTNPQELLEELVSLKFDLFKINPSGLERVSPKDLLGEVHCEIYAERSR